MRAFEEKCRRLYETRLTDYIERTDQQLSEYESQLLQVFCCFLIYIKFLAVNAVFL